VDERGPALYVELFGTAKQEEFSAAMAAFAVQFSATLKGGGSRGFFERGYQTKPRGAFFSKFRLRNQPCVVSFEYGGKDFIDAELWGLEDEDQLLFFRWVNGVWEFIGAGITTEVSDGGRKAKR